MRTRVVVAGQLAKVAVGAGVFGGHGAVCGHADVAEQIVNVVYVCMIVTNMLIIIMIIIIIIINVM